MYERLTVPEFYVIVARKIKKISEIYKFAQKCLNFTWRVPEKYFSSEIRKFGAGTRAPIPRMPVHVSLGYATDSSWNVVNCARVVSCHVLW